MVFLFRHEAARKVGTSHLRSPPVLLLDEPCTNLDHEGVTQYTQWLEKFAHGRLVIVASNDPREYGFCGETLVMDQYK